MWHLTSLSDEWLVVTMKAFLAESNKQDQQLIVPIRNNGGKGKPPHFSRTCNLTCRCRYKCNTATSVVAIPVSGWNKCPPGHLPQEYPWSHWLLWLREVCHQEDATKALPHLYASAKHSHAMNAKGESSNKYANLQSKYVGNLAKIKTLNATWTQEICHIPLSFLHSFYFQGKPLGR
jgi:hypothetical protein